MESRQKLYTYNTYYYYTIISSMVMSKEYTLKISSLVPRLPPLRAIIFLLQKRWLFLHEFKGHAIIARKGGSLGTRLQNLCYIGFISIIIIGK